MINISFTPGPLSPLYIHQHQRQKTLAAPKLGFSRRATPETLAVADYPRPYPITLSITMAKGPKKPRKAPRTPRDAEPVDDDDMDDEIDAFHKQRDVVPLDVDDDEVDSDDEEFPVLGIEDSTDDESGEGKSDDAGDDDDIYDDKEIAKMKRQAKHMEQIVGGNEEMSDDAEPEKESRAPWGRRKSTYYTTDGRDNESSDEEKSKAEEAEAVRMQKERLNFLRMEDLDLPSDSDLDPDDSDSGQEKIFQGISGGMETMAKSKDDNILGGTPLESFEEIKSQKDINAMSKEEQMNLVYRYAPELVPWLSELKDAHAQLEKVKPFLSKVGEMKDATKGRLHYLEVKNILLLAYIQAISCYLLLKLEGHSVRDHPVKARISEIQNLSKQMKQIEMNLPSQIEELVSLSSVTDLQDMLVRESVSSELKPEMPKQVNNATKLTDDHSEEYHNKAASQKQQDVLMSLQSKEMLKVRANLEAKLKQKGIFNLTNAKPERNRNHALMPVNQRLETLEDFDDEVQHVSRGKNNIRTGGSNPIKISQMVVATKAKKPKFVSGDDDLPKRDDIGERRRKHELRVLAGAGAGAGAESMDINAQEDSEAQDSEDELYKEAKKHRRVTAQDAENEFYKQVKKQRKDKLQAKEELYSRVSVFPPPLEAEADGKRHITRQIEKNRGLTRHRKKETKTPRKNNRMKFERAQKRRKGQVRDIKKPSGPYGGEQTGINTNVSHSVRFRN